MFPVSADYITAMQAKSRRTSLRGTITFPDTNVTENFTLRDIADGSVSIEKNCLDGDALEFGGVVCAALEIGLRTSRSRYTFFGAIINLRYSLLVGYENDEEVWEDVPLGIYTVSDAETTDNVVSLTAYDCLKNLDIPLGDVVINGTAYEILQEVAERTGVPLGFQASDISAWDNSTYTYQFSKDSGCSTYRDVVKVVCQPMGAFAYATRDGMLALRRFNESVIRTLTKQEMYTLVVADYQCWYNSLTVSGVAGTFTAGADAPNNGIDMVIADAPAWDYGAKGVLGLMVSDLFSYLEGITYTPVEMTIPNDPSFDCGDRLELESDKGAVETIITNYTWKFGSAMEVNSEGTNPYLANVSTAEHSSQRITNAQSAANEMVIYEFTNSHDVTVDINNFTEVARVIFYTTRETSVIFAATIQLDNKIDDEVVTTEETITAKTSGGVVTPIYDSQGNPLTLTCPVSDTIKGSNEVTLKYTLNDDPQTDMPQDTVHNGHQLITVIYPMSVVTPNIPYVWKVFMKTDGGRIVLPRSTMKAIIFGSGLQKIEGWDGIIEAEDVITAHTGGAMHIGEILEQFGYRDTWDEDSPIREHPSDVVEAHSGGAMHVGELEEEIDVVMMKDQYDIQSADEQYQIGSSDDEWYLGTSE